LHKVTVWHFNYEHGVPCPYVVEGPSIEIDIEGTQVKITVEDETGKEIATHFVRGLLALSGTVNGVDAGEM
jgi:hypothetical protein